MMRFVSKFFIGKGGAESRIKRISQNLHRTFKNFRVQAMIRRFPTQPMDQSARSSLSKFGAKNSNASHAESQLFGRLAPAQMMFGDLTYHVQSIQLTVLHGQSVLHY